MNTAKRAQEVSEGRPDAFNTIRMNLANPISIVISCPLTFFMTDHSVWTIKTVIPTPTICINAGIRGRELMRVSRQCLFIRVMNPTQSNMTTLATERVSNHRGTVIGVGAVAFAFVSAPTGRVSGVSMSLTFLTSVLEHLIGFGILIR